MGIFDIFKKDDEKADFSNVESGSSSTAPEPTEQTTEPAQPFDPEPRQVVHTVNRGDTLWDIAEQYYGDGKRWREIHEANEHVIDDPDQISPGQSFVIPMKDSEASV